MSNKNEIMIPTNDYVFKRIFGYKGKENITKDLIESITNYKINSITVEQSTTLEKDLKNDKIGILDVQATLNNNIQSDIEMQVVKYANIEKRILYYWSKLYVSSIRESNKYGQLKKTIVILIANFEPPQLNSIPKFHTEFQIREKDFCEIILTDVLELHIINLPKMLEMLNNNEINKNDKLTLWSRFLVNPNEIGGIEMSNNKNLKDAKDLLDHLSSDKHEQKLAELRMKYIMDEQAIREGGYNDGLAEGEKIRIVQRRKTW